VTDHAPLVEGHLLIIPKTHYACYGAAPAELDAELFALKDEASRFLGQFYANVIFWEHGVFQQTVYHAHLHCFPFGDVSYDPSTDLHQTIVTSQQDIRSWYQTQGQYFYLEDAHHALLFAPARDSYLRIIQEVLRAGVVARNGHTQWRPPQQRYAEREPLIQSVIANWRTFQHQQQGA
jgi:diadenosine tetraphosphate (Ap4A) HIT family hydrolase